jgi:hypothetical protein
LPQRDGLTYASIGGVTAQTIGATPEKGIVSDIVSIVIVGEELSKSSVLLEVAEVVEVTGAPPADCAGVRLKYDHEFRAAFLKILINRINKRALQWHPHVRCPRFDHSVPIERVII